MESSKCWYCLGNLIETVVSKMVIDFNDRGPEEGSWRVGGGFPKGSVVVVFGFQDGCEVLVLF